MNFVGGRATTTANPSASREKRDPRPSDKLPDAHTEQRKTALKYEESFVDKNFIVTGATGAIGSAVAKKLLGAGATVALFARDADKLENLVRDPACRMGKYFAVCHNFKEDPKILERKVRESIEKLKGKLDGLICCHGTFKAGTLKDTTIKDWDVITNVNVRTFIMMTSLCVPFLKMTKGNAVILTSTAGEVPTPGALAFCVSKSMVNMMIECAALELAYFGVRVNGVAEFIGAQTGAFQGVPDVVLVLLVIFDNNAFAHEMEVWRHIGSHFLDTRSQEGQMISRSHIFKNNQGRAKDGGLSTYTNLHFTKK